MVGGRLNRGWTLVRTRAFHMHVTVSDMHATAEGHDSNRTVNGAAGVQEWVNGAASCRNELTVGGDRGAV